MRNGILGFIVFLASSFLVSAQTWAPVGTGITGADANTTWTLYAYDSVLYAGGYFDTAGGIAINSLAQWNGIQWDSVSALTNGYINAMAIYHGNLYAGGQFSRMGGVSACNIAKWNGSAWLPVGPGLKDGDYGVNAMVVYEGSLYVAGSFDSSGTQVMHYIARWNDTNWSPVGAIIPAVDADDGIFTLAVYNGDLYMGGDFTAAGGTNFLKWNGTTLTSPLAGTTGYVYSLAVFNNKLYLGGLISQAGAVATSCVAIWDGSNFSSSDSGIWGENGWAIVNAMTVYNHELYVGGYFDSIKGAQLNCLAKWNGSQWSSVGNVNMGGSIDAISVFNNTLYIGGGFDSVGGVYAKNIAMYTAPSAVDKFETDNTVNIFPNPSTGIFTIQLNNEELKINNKIEVFNVLGEKVYSDTPFLPSPKGGGTSFSYTMNISSQPNGIYLYRVLAENGELIGEGKVVISR